MGERQLLTGHEWCRTPFTMVVHEIHPYLEASLPEGQGSLAETSHRSRQPGLPSKAPLYFALCLLGVAVLYFASGTLGESSSRLTRTADELQHTQSLLETQAIKDKINAVEQFLSAKAIQKVPTQTTLERIREEYSQIFTAKNPHSWAGHMQLAASESS